MLDPAVAFDNLRPKNDFSKGVQYRNVGAVVTPSSKSRMDTPTHNAGKTEFTVVEFIPHYGGASTCVEETPIQMPNKTDYNIELASVQVKNPLYLKIVKHYGMIEL